MRSVWLLPESRVCASDQYAPDLVDSHQVCDGIVSVRDEPRDVPRTSVGEAKSLRAPRVGGGSFLREQEEAASRFASLA
jgi:hypothetical protein